MSAVDSFPEVVNNEHAGNWISASGHKYTRSKVVDELGNPSIVVDAGAGLGTITKEAAARYDDAVVLAVDPYAGYGQVEGRYFDLENAFAVDMDVEDFLDGVSKGDLDDGLLDQLDIEYPGLHEGQLDTIVASGFFVSTSKPYLYLEKIADALPTGGRLVRSGPNSDSVESTAPDRLVEEQDRVYEVKFPYAVNGAEDTYTQKVPLEFDAELKERGFDKKHEEEVSFNPRGLQTLTHLLEDEEWQERLQEAEEHMKSFMEDNGEDDSIDLEGGLEDWGDKVFNKYVEQGKDEAVPPKGVIWTFEKA